jgi:ureidoacrylate peracid hydrolase
MAQLTYEKEITGPVLIDPYNNFISEGGKIWDRIKGVAERNRCVAHMQRLLEAARKTGISRIGWISCAAAVEAA